MENNNGEMMSPLSRNIPLRMEYREVLSETQKLGLEDPGVLEKSFHMAEELFSQVSTAREAMYDSRLVNLHSHIIKKRAEALYTSDFDPEKFGDRLVSFYRKENLTDVDLLKELGKESYKTMRTPPNFHFMYGTFEPGEVEVKKKPRKERIKDKCGKLQTPNLVTPDSSKDNETSSEVQRVFSILTSLCKRRSSSIPYFEFVINPHSFPETVENMFYVSILVKEGAARIYLDDDGDPLIECIPYTEQQTIRSSRPPSQAVFSINMRNWERIVQKFDIRKPRIPSRTSIAKHS